MFQELNLPLFALILGGCACASADNISFAGLFTSDTDTQYFTFTLLHDTPNVSLRTWSYSGGTNSQGATIDGGGFVPILNLYQGDGTQMNPGVGGPCTIPLTGNPLVDLTPDSVTGECSDVYYPTTESFPGGLWLAGTYTLVLTEDGNPGVGNLFDGFFAEVVDGLTPGDNFTCQVGAPGFQGNPPTVPVGNPFCDEFDAGVERTGAWALDFNNVDSATELSATPEPGTLVMLALATVGLLAFGVLRARAGARLAS